MYGNPDRNSLLHSNTHSFNPNTTSFHGTFNEGTPSPLLAPPTTSYHQTSSPRISFTRNSTAAAPPAYPTNITTLPPPSSTYQNQSIIYNNASTVYPNNTSVVYPNNTSVVYPNNTSVVYPNNTSVVYPNNTSVVYPNTTYYQQPITHYSGINTYEQPGYYNNSIVNQGYNGSSVLQGSAVHGAHRTLRTSYQPVVNYVPVVEEVEEPYVDYSRLSQQRQIVHQPELFEMRETHYRMPAETYAAPIVYRESGVEHYDPMVQTVRGPSWGGQSMRSSKIRAPPPPAQEKQTKGCPWWLWALLGLLALIGLILAIIFGSKHGSDVATPSKVSSVVAPSTIDTPKSNNTYYNSSTAHSRPPSVLPSTSLANATIDGNTAVTSPLVVAPGTTSIAQADTSGTAGVVRPVEINSTTNVYAEKIPGTTVSKNDAQYYNGNSGRYSNSGSYSNGNSGSYSNGNSYNSNGNSYNSNGNSYNSTTTTTTTTTTSGSQGSSSVQPITYEGYTTGINSYNSAQNNNGGSSGQNNNNGYTENSNSNSNQYTYTGPSSVQPIPAQPVTNANNSSGSSSTSSGSSSFGSSSGSSGNTTTTASNYNNYNSIQPTTYNGNNNYASNSYSSNNNGNTNSNGDSSNSNTPSSNSASSSNSYSSSRGSTSVQPTPYNSNGYNSQQQSSGSIAPTYSVVQPQTAQPIEAQPTHYFALE